MDCTNYSPYTLPTIEFVGGETQDLVFHVYFYANNKPFGMVGSSANFSVVNYLNRTGAAVISKAMDVAYNADGTVMNVLTVTLDPADTLNMSGKYIYQISIRDIGGDAEIPKQGILHVINNINKDFMR